MLKLSALLLLGALGAAPASLAEDAAHTGLHVAHGWARASLGGNPNAAAYVTLHNKSDEADTLTGVTCAGASTCAVHNHVMNGDVMKMTRIESLVLEPGAHITFKPGGFHIMMMKVGAPLVAGGETAMIFHFEDAGDVSVTVPVLSLKEAAARADHGDKHKAMHEEH